MDTLGAKIASILLVAATALAALVGVALALAALGAGVYALLKPKVALKALQGLLRRPPKGQLTGPDHYYKPYWAAGPEPPAEK